MPAKIAVIPGPEQTGSAQRADGLRFVDEGAEQSQPPRTFVPKPVIPASVRTRSKLEIVFADEGNGPFYKQDYQSGSLRHRQCRTPPGQPLSSVLVNTAGGLTGGDRLDQHMIWTAGAAATVTSQAAEKVYKSDGLQTTINTRLTVAANALAEWLPQETILFNGCHLDRKLVVVVEDDAECLCLESVVFGRLARGERLASARLNETLRVEHNGKTLLYDRIKLEGDIDAQLQRAAIGNGARAMASIIKIGSDLRALLDGVRSADTKTMVAASHWDRILFIRIMAADDAALRSDVSLLLNILRSGSRLPQNWSC